MKPYHGVPALLGLFFPGLGQLVKGQWERALFVWGLIFGPWIGLGIEAGYAASVYSNSPSPGDIVLIITRSQYLPFVLPLTGIIWLWSIVDAYRHPAT